MPEAARRLAAYRRELGMTQLGLAARLRVHRATVIRWEQGDATPRQRVRPHLADALGLSQDTLEELLGPADLRVVQAGNRVQVVDTAGTRLLSLSPQAAAVLAAGLTTAAGDASG